MVRFVLCVAALAALTVAVSDQTFLWGEVGLLRFWNDVPTALGWPLRVVMALGTLWGALAVAAVTVWATRDRDRWAGWTVLLAVALAFRADNVLKDLIDRPRPPAVLDGLHVREHIGGYGFPSGHTTMAFALAAALHATVPARWRWTVWAGALVVGLARMHVGVHWPADVAGGAALGTAIGSASWLLTRRPAGRLATAEADASAPRPRG